LAKFCCEETISAQKRSLGLIGNLETHFWTGVMATKKYFFPHGSFSIRDGSKIRFWEDKWLGTTTLQKQYLVLYNIVLRKVDTLHKVMETSPPSMTFKRDLIGPWLTSWNELIQRLTLANWYMGPMNFAWDVPRTVYSRLVLCIKL
jgi:hypothetical protein